MILYRRIKCERCNELGVRCWECTVNGRYVQATPADIEAAYAALQPQAVPPGCVSVTTEDMGTQRLTGVAALRAENERLEAEMPKAESVPKYDPSDGEEFNAWGQHIAGFFS